MTSKQASKTNALHKYLLQKPKVQYHRSGLSQEKLHILVLYTSEGYSGLIQKQITWSRQANPTLTSGDEWHKLIKDFENKKMETTGPITPENPSMALKNPGRRTTASPRLNSTSSPPPNPINVQCSTQIPTRYPPADKENPIDMHSTPTLVRPTNGSGKQWHECYTTPRHAKTKPPATSEKKSIQKSLDESFVDRLSAMKISGTSKPGQ
jgi:hypothetical protein